MKVRLAILAGAVAVAFGCASTPAPNERMATAKAGVRSARELGADNVPDAALHVKLAEEQIQRADRAIADGDNERAAVLLERASSDADLAVALAHEQRAHSATQVDLPSDLNP